MLKLKQIGGECCSKEWGAKLDEFVWVIMSIVNLFEITGERIFLSRVVSVDVSSEDMNARVGKYIDDPNPREQDLALYHYEYGNSDTEYETASECPLTAMLKCHQFIKERFG